MFEGLRNAFSGAARSLNERELREKDVDGVLAELELSLLESDVAGEVVDEIKSDLKSKLVGSKVDRHEVEGFVRDSLVSSISSLFDAAGSVDMLGMVGRKKEQGAPFLILFVGINGTGKTTTLAKVAHMLRQAKYSVVVAASDTFRAGAIEQLREHTKRLNLKLVAQNYNSDPAAVARDAVLYARSHKTDCVLIDTAGRMQTSKNLMEQIEKITKVVNPDMKIFVGDSLAGNDTVNQAREFYEHTKFDASILTKGDADARGGAALSIVQATSTPVIYVGVGQEYADLRPFDKEMFLETVFGPGANAGSPQDDPGSPQDDPGSPQDDPGSPQDDPGSPQDDPGSPQDDPGSPQDDPGSPQDDPGSPQDDPGSPQDDPGSPQDDPGTSNADPFAGIDDADIATYSETHDVPPPENDGEASKMAQDIRRWIAGGRPGREKPKKQRGRFGFGK